MKLCHRDFAVILVSETTHAATPAETSSAGVQLLESKQACFVNSA